MPGKENEKFFLKSFDTVAGKWEVCAVMHLAEKYSQLQAIRESNKSFRVPPVYHGAWTDKDWARWEEGRKNLPPFAQWVKDHKPSVKITSFGETKEGTREQAAEYLRTLRINGFRLVRDRVRSCIGITAWHENSGFIAVSYKISQ